MSGVVDVHGRHVPLSVITARARMWACGACGAMADRPCREYGREVSIVHECRWNAAAMRAAHLLPMSVGLNGLMAVLDRGGSSG